MAEGLGGQVHWETAGISMLLLPSWPKTTPNFRRYGSPWSPHRAPAPNAQLYWSVSGASAVTIRSNIPPSFPILPFHLYILTAVKRGPLFWLTPLYFLLAYLALLRRVMRERGTPWCPARVLPKQTRVVPVIGDECEALEARTKCHFRFLCMGTVPNSEHKATMRGATR